MLLQRGSVVYRLRPSVRLDTYGDPIEDWEHPERMRLRGAVVQSGTRAEDPDRLLPSQRNLFCPGKLDVSAEDRIEIDGEQWDVVGGPRIRHGLAMGTYTLVKLERSERRRYGQEQV